MAGVGQQVGVFISYRRSDEAGFAGRLYDILAAKFGSKRIFMDVDSIEYGLDFTDELDTALAQCKVLLAVIGPRWVSATDDHGQLRLGDANDYVRLEIERGLVTPGVRVVPVLVNGAEMPKASQLPENLLELRHRNACLLSHGRFKVESIELTRTIEQILADGPSRDIQVIDLTNDAAIADRILRAFQGCHVNARLVGTISSFFSPPDPCGLSVLIVNEAVTDARNPMFGRQATKIMGRLAVIDIFDGDGAVAFVLHPKYPGVKAVRLGKKCPNVDLIVERIVELI